MMNGLKRGRLPYAAFLFACVSAWSADRPPQHPELRMAINLGKYDQAREYIKQGVEDVYCGDMPADSAKAVWAKRWKQNPELALTGCLPQYTHFYPEKACEIRGVSPNICPGRLKDSTTLADPERFAALAKAALSNPEHKTRLRGEIATLGEERLIVLADEAGFDFVRDSVLPEKMAAWAGMLRDLQRKFKLFGNGEKDFYPGSEKWTASAQVRERIAPNKERKGSGGSGRPSRQAEALLPKTALRGDSGNQPEENRFHILKIVEVADYTPYGRRIVVYSDGASTTPQFTGKEMDAETGLYHFGARQYDPELAMWAQVDPGRQFASPYAYAGNGVNPINGADPNGLSHIVFTRSESQIQIFSAKGELLQTYPAANNTERKSNGPWPSGKYPFSRHKDHPENVTSYGNNGNFIFDVPGRPGMGVHSGRGTPTYVTKGCVRTTDDATAYLLDLHKNDPLEFIIIRDEPPLVRDYQPPPFDEPADSGPTNQWDAVVDFSMEKTK